MLKFSWKRRLLIGVAFVVMATIAVLISFLLTVGLDLPVQPVVIVVNLLLIPPVLLLDGVETA